MFCTKCGAKLSEGAKFCPKCGTECSFEKKVVSGVQGVFESTEKEVENAVNDVRQTFSNAGNSNGNGAGGQRLTDNRGLAAYILLSIITCGIYSYYFLYKIAVDVNIACDGDGEKTSGLVIFIILSVVTCGIYAWYWYYKLGNRLSANAPRYGLSFQENGTTILLWLLLGTWLCGLGTFVAMYILIKNTNCICNAYNRAHGL